MLTDQHSKVILNKLQHLSTHSLLKNMIINYFSLQISIKKILFYKIIFH